MRPNYAQDAPPTSIEVGGFAYDCDVNWLTWIDVLRMLRGLPLRARTDDELHRLAEGLTDLQVRVFGGVLVDEDPAEVLAAIAEFSRGYPVPPVADTEAGEPVYSFDYDLNDIIIAIRDQHGVDLSYRRTEPLHWWEFLLLFRTLAGSHYITMVMEARGYRGKDRELLRRKRALALPEELTEEEQAELDAFSAQFAAPETIKEEVTEHDSD